MDNNEDIFECAPFFNVATTQSYGAQQNEVQLKRNLSETCCSVETPGMTLQWGNLSVSTKQRARQCSLLTSLATTFNVEEIETPGEKILDNVCGVAYPGSLMMIISSSDFQNTTLLKALALKLSPSLIVSGKVAVNGQVVERRHLQRMTGFVDQNNPFYPTFTVREHLWFTAKLKLDSRFTNDQIRHRINGIINQTGLRSREKESIRNLSVADRKRLAIASETIGDPLLVFCDEPTRELNDPQEAYKLVGILESMAAKGKTVLCSIRQPSSHVFNMFTDVCLLTRHGQIAFIGPVRESTHFFERQLLISISIAICTYRVSEKLSLLTSGYYCPPYHNPANYYLQKMTFNSNDELKLICDKFSTSRYSSRLTNSISCSIRRQQPDTSLDSYTNYNAERYKSSWLTQLNLILKRTTLKTLRERRKGLLKISQKLLMAILASMLFFKVDLNVSSNVIGISLLLIISNFHPTLYNVINSLPKEIPTLLKETQNQLYRVETFYLARFLVSIPECLLESLLSVAVVYWIIGIHNNIVSWLIVTFVIVFLTNVAFAIGCLFSTVFEDIKTLTFILIPLDCILLVLGGLFTNISAMDPSVRWLQYFSWFRYANLAVQKIIFGENNNSIKLKAGELNVTMSLFQINVTEQELSEEYIAMDFLALGLFCIGLHTLSCLALILKSKFFRNKIFN